MLGLLQCTPHFRHQLTPNKEHGADTGQYDNGGDYGGLRTPVVGEQTNAGDKYQGQQQGQAKLRLGGDGAVVVAVPGVGVEEQQQHHGQDAQECPRHQLRGGLVAVHEHHGSVEQQLAEQLLDLEPPQGGGVRRVDEPQPGGGGVVPHVAQLEEAAHQLLAVVRLQLLHLYPCGGH